MDKEWYEDIPDTIDKPKPIIRNGKKYCPYCWENGVQTELKHKSYLCHGIGDDPEGHAEVYRRNLEKIRKRKSRKGISLLLDKESGKRQEWKYTKAKEHETLLGTTNFGFKIQRNKDGTPNFDEERKIISNEAERIKDGRTIGDEAIKHTGGGFLPEIRELRKDDFAISDDGTELIRYDKEHKEIIDVDETGFDVREGRWIPCGYEPLISQKEKELRLYHRNLLVPPNLREQYRRWGYGKRKKKRKK